MLREKPEASRRGRWSTEKQGTAGEGGEGVVTLLARRSNFQQDKLAVHTSVETRAPCAVLWLASSPDRSNVVANLQQRRRLRTSTPVLPGHDALASCRPCQLSKKHGRFVFSTSAGRRCDCAVSGRYLPRFFPLKERSNAPTAPHLPFLYASPETFPSRVHDIVHCRGPRCKTRRKAISTYLGRESNCSSALFPR